MSEEHVIDYVINVDSGMAYTDIRKLEISLIRIGAIVKRLSGGNEDVTKLISVINRLIWALRAAQIAIHAFEVAAGPIGWFYAGITAISSTVMVGEALYDMGRGT